MFWVVVSGAHGFHGGESSDADGRDGCFGAAGEHQVGVAHFDCSPGFAKGVAGGGAGGAGSQVGASQSMIHGEKAGSHVENLHGDQKGRESIWSFFQEDLMLSFDGLESADSRPHEHAEFVQVCLFQIDSGILDCLESGEDAKLGVAVGAANFFGIGEGRRNVQLVDLGGNAASVLANVEGGDGDDAAVAAGDSLPEAVDGIA